MVEKISNKKRLSICGIIFLFLFLGALLTGASFKFSIITAGLVALVIFFFTSKYYGDIDDRHKRNWEIREKAYHQGKGFQEGIDQAKYDRNTEYYNPSKSMFGQIRKR